jgi:hypothetical protein
MALEAAGWIAVAVESGTVMSANTNYDAVLEAAIEIFECYDYTGERERIAVYPATAAVLAAYSEPTDDFSWDLRDGLAVAIGVDTCR